ncbi:DoxX family protein [Alteromonas sp.]|nr:DoxX family protein [Alteromonas sp.]
MNNTIKKYGLLFIKVIVGLAFLSAGLAKISGVEMMVQTFEAIGFGQWFRYLTGAIEVFSAVLLFIPGRQYVGALLLVCTMIGAIAAHWIWLGPSALPAAMLGLLAGIIAFSERPGKTRFQERRRAMR